MTKNEKEMTYEEVKEALDSAADALEDDGGEVNLQDYDSEPRRRNFETLLKMYADKELVVPIYQRGFVWGTRKQKKFIEDALRQRPTPSWMIAEYKGVYSLVDGLQRFTTLSLAIRSENTKLTKEQKAKLRKYKVDTTTINNVYPKEQRELFQDYNGGILVSGAIKQRANLNETLETLITTIVSEEFPEDFSPSVSFNKSAHHDIITENALLAVAGVKLDSNRPEILVKLLNENETAVIQNQDKARDIIKRLVSLYQNDVSEKLTRKSLNANFVSILARVIVDYSNFNNEDIVKVISYIFASSPAIPEYKITTDGGSGDSSKCQMRYDLLVELLNNPPEIKIDPKQEQLDKKKAEKAEEKAYKAFLKKYKDTDIYDSTGEHAVFIKKFTDNELKALYNAQCDKDQSAFDKIIINRANSSVS